MYGEHVTCVCLPRMLQGTYNVVHLELLMGVALIGEECNVITSALLNTMMITTLWDIEGTGLDAW